jgi:hypothetical protein
MKNQRLIHDVSRAMAFSMLTIVKPCLREEEQLEALNEFYVACRAGIESFCLQQERINNRLKPMDN